MGQFRGRFIRDIYELMSRARGAVALDRLSSGLPERLRQSVLPIALSSDGAGVECVSLDDAEEFFVLVDGILGDRTTEQSCADLAVRALAQNGTLVVGFDLLGTVQRLRGWLAGPFVGVDVVLELAPTAEGFSLVVGVQGRPRATRLLGKMAMGAVTASERFAMETSGSLTVSSSVLGDRWKLDVRFHSVRAEEDIPLPPKSVRDGVPGSTRPSHFGQLSAEVEEILASTRDANARPLGFWSAEPREALQRKQARHSPSGMMKAAEVSNPPSRIPGPELHPPSGVYATDQPSPPQPLPIRKGQPPSGAFPLGVSPPKPKVGKDGG